MPYAALFIGRKNNIFLSLSGNTPKGLKIAISFSWLMEIHARNELEGLIERTEFKIDLMIKEREELGLSIPENYLVQG